MNQGIGNDEILSAEIGQVGTQFDGLGHVGVHHNGRNLFYNGFDLAEFGDTYGFTKLGVENVGVFFTRGILLDVAKVRKTERLEGGYVVTPADLTKAETLTGTKIEPADAVFLRTGHGQLWMVDNETYGTTEPGLGVASAKWLTDRKICLVGADTWAIEAVPPRRPTATIPCPPLEPRSPWCLSPRKP